MKYIWIVLAFAALFFGIHFAGDLIRATVGGLLTAGCLYFGYRAWQKEKEGE